MSELDKERRGQLVNFIEDSIQTFITATDKAFFPEIQSAHYYTVCEGIVEG
jgi:DNA replication and repair protein RecF